MAWQSKICKMVRLSAPEYGESGKPNICAFRHQWRFFHLRLLSSDWLMKPISTQAQALWEMMTPPDNELPTPGRHVCHGCPWPPLSASVGGGGARDQLTPQRYCWGSIGSVTSHTGGQVGAIFTATHRVRHPHLPQVPRLRGVPSNQTGVTHLAVDQPGRNGASPALIFLCPSWPVFYEMAALRLRGGSPRRGLSPGGGDPGGILCRASRFLFPTAGRQPCTCWGSLPAPLAVNSVQEGEEASGGRLWYGLLGDDLCAPRWLLSPPRLRRQHHRGDQDFVSFTYQSSAALRRGT